MPTLPPTSSTEPHRHRAVAESFGLDPQRYDRTRPTYPPALAETIVADLPGRRLLDVGIGTGLSALPFRALGAHVVGVEPDPRMAELARQRGFEVEVARFEDWDPAGRVFDAVISGQAWHWVDPVAGPVKAAVALRPGGRIALFWNVFQPAPDVAAAFSTVYRRVETGLPFNPWSVDPMLGQQAIVQKVVDGLQRCGSFGEVRQWRTDWSREYTRDEWLDLVPTSGGHNLIPRPRLDELLAGLGAVIDAAGGRITVGYATVLLAASRTDGR
ncbi:MAG: class I SAM-dependent methyltransferase [Micromonosporaceae bacterium]|nr:class I SAM-dependent methyltransferase [Micromonosporaceae bacterium]